MNTLLIDQQYYDLCLDASGNIAVASAPYSIVQDVCSACRTFLGEVFYDTTLGIPYFTQILGQFPPPALIKAQLVAAALTVPLVTSATVYLSAIHNRSLSGQVQFTYSTPTTPSKPALGIVSFFGTGVRLITFIGSNSAAVSFGANP